MSPAVRAPAHSPAISRPRGRPPRLHAGRGDTRAALIRCGTELLTEKGFHGTGVDALLKRLGIPKGSFYHYFASKEEFGLAVIDNYATYFARKLDRLLGDAGRSPLARLRAFVAEGKAGMLRHRFRRGCLVGILGQEVGGRDDPFRQRLDQVFAHWQERVAVCLEEAKAAGELAADADTRRLAAFFWIGWEGAILRAKLTRSSAPLDLFADTFFDSLPQ
jgi:TetR/AcrR family transcriptional repressor of nem operon